MAALNITARDVMLAVQAQNAVNPAGKIGAQPAPPDQQLSFTVKAPGRLTSVKEFENIVVRGQDSSIVRVGDIARVELGSETYSLSSSVNGMPPLPSAFTRRPEEMPSSWWTISKTC